MGVASIMTALAIGGGILKGGAGLSAGRAEGRASDFNALVADQQARQERQSAAAEARDYRRGENRKLASSTAARGAGGVTGAGSPLLVEESTIREIALGSARLKYAGDVRSKRLQDEAELYRMRGKSARRAGYLNAGSSLLSGASSWAANYGWR